MFENTKTLQLEMPQKAFDRLKELKEKTEASSYADVVKNALRLYEALIDEVEGGGLLYIESQDGAKSRIKPIF